MMSKLALPTYFLPWSLFNRQVRLYLWAEALTGFTVDGGLYAVLFSLYLLRLGYSPALIGIASAAGAVIFAGCSLPAGLLGGRWSSQRLLAGGLALMMLACGALPLAELISPGWRAGWIIGCYVLISMGLAAYIANATPFVVEFSNAAERNRIFSLATALWFLGGFAGNLVGGWLPSLFVLAQGGSLENPAPYRYGLWFAVLCLIPPLWGMSSLRQASSVRTSQQAAKLSLFPFRQIGWLAVVRLLTVMGVATVFIFLTVYLDKGLGVQITGIGALLASGRLGAVLAALLLPTLAARWDRRRIILGGTLCTALSLLPLVLIAHWSAAALAFIGVVALVAIRMPAFLVYSMETVAPEHRAAMSGASEMANGLGGALIGWGGGYVITSFGYRPLFLLGASATALAALLFWWGSRGDTATRLASKQ